VSNRIIKLVILATLVVLALWVFVAPFWHQAAVAS
jgi:hypothetical protein